MDMNQENLSNIESLNHEDRTVNSPVEDTETEISSNTTQVSEEKDEHMKDIMERTDVLIQSLKKRAEELIQWQEEIRAEQKKAEELSKQIGEQSKKLLEVESLQKMVQNREELLNKREDELEKRELEFDRRYQERFTELENKHKTWEQEHLTKKQTLDQQQLSLSERENKIAEKENSLETSLAQQKADVTRELMDEKKKGIESFREWTSIQEMDWSDKLKKLLSEHEQSLSTMREKVRNEAQSILEKEREAALKQIEEELAQKKQELKEMSDLQSQLELERDKIKVQKALLSKKEANIEKIIKDTKSSELEALNQELIEEKQAYNELLERLQEKNEQLRKYEQIQADWGENPPEEMEKIINSLKKDNERLREELIHRPNDFDLAQMEELKNRNKNLSDQLNQLRREKQQMENGHLEFENAKIELERRDRKIQNLKFSIEDLEHDNTVLRNKIERLRTDDGLAAERKKRIESIENFNTDTIVVAPSLLKGEEPIEIDEIEWLDKIGRNCFEYGFKFPKRILYEFHTALKISDWSTITVLAGVSGTGKSELPHLYARFGGLNFCPVSVQPNWDSQESMLGFFNSIDNKFDVQPVLRFLVQCSSEKNNMNRSLNIVLLDEMNLAHVEHYFAEFLSKLELRRDYSDDKIQHIDINIGAGIQPYELYLTRNVLWAGTMNQDETTKSLSDKVLDRGIIIHFPRPKRLIGRQEKKDLDKFVEDKKIQMLDYHIWRDQWLRKPNFDDDQKKEMQEYKNTIEEINNCLAKAGRALGHRVWQSIEYYIANYPLVIKQQNQSDTDELKKAMRIAFEDQLVQKVMPKLRGIETTGVSRDECLEPIGRLLQEKYEQLVDDFNQACNYGYGQFIWNSADYIDDNEIAGKVDNNEDGSDEDNER